MDMESWANKAKEYQMPHVRTAYAEELDKVDAALFSWIQYYDSVTKTKVGVDGFSVYLPSTRDLYLLINDTNHDVIEEWTLQTHGCKATGQGKPAFIATNMDLSNSLKAA
jgi:hypothetical protein